MSNRNSKSTFNSSVYNGKKRHNYQKNINQDPRIPKHYQDEDETIPFNNNDFFESKAKSEDKAAQAYKLLYAEMMKLFVLESGATKDTTLTETELDQHIFLAANEYFDFNNDIYDVSTFYSCLFVICRNTASTRITNFTYLKIKHKHFQYTIQLYVNTWE